jgi:hypothetical protein
MTSRVDAWGFCPLAIGDGETPNGVGDGRAAAGRLGHGVGLLRPCAPVCARVRQCRPGAHVVRLLARG